MTTTFYSLKEWDSAFFGFPVAEINLPTPDIQLLQTALQQLKNSHITLAYFPTKGMDDGYVEAVKGIGGRLVDVKVVYSLLLDNMKIDKMPDVKIERYNLDHVTPELYSLAIQSGQYSRFAVDPKMPAGKFEELYATWIRKSVSGELADDVLVVRDGSVIVGMVALQAVNDTGWVKLIAVDRHFQGKKYGERLMKATHALFANKGLHRVSVVTQKANSQACGLYEKCGYTVESVNSYFHFWL